MIERTLAILKPDCIRRNVIGEVIATITKAGFSIRALRMTRLTPRTAGAFYEVHKGKPFYEGLVEFMCSGPCVPIVLERENAVAEFRTVIGATDPAEAAPGTVRKLYAASKGENIVHGSDSPENALREIAFFFAQKELV